MASPSIRSTGWQDQLEEICRQRHLGSPAYNIVSDRRGGRTAWSSTVTVTGHHTSKARFVYDNVNNAKEDAAEVALKTLGGNSGVPRPTQFPALRAGVM